MQQKLWVELDQLGHRIYIGPPFSCMSRVRMDEIHIHACIGGRPMTIHMDMHLRIGS